jgi:hypothetical protein
MASMTGRAAEPVRANATSPGLPPEQVRAWLACVRDDLARVRARLEYLKLEEQRLEEQHHLLAQLFESSVP